MDDHNTHSFTPPLSDAGWEEYYDYLFPDEVKAVGTLKLLQNVQAWKKRKMGGAGALGGAGDAATAVAAAASSEEAASAP